MMTKRKLWVTLGPALAFILIATYIGYKYIDPAPPKRFVISTSDGEGDYQAYANLYKEIIKEDGIELVVRSSTGAVENYERLKDSKSEVDVGFVYDGLGSTEDAPDLSSMGSVYYEPLWIFYRKGRAELKRFSQLAGKRIAIGHHGGGTQALATRLLKASGVDEKNSTLTTAGWEDARNALAKDQVDAAIFLATPEDPLIDKLLADNRFRLMNLDQAEAIARRFPYLHHLVLPHGAVDLKNDLPDQDVHLIAPTATLLAKDSLHPALAYLLLKAAAQVHGNPGIFEKKNEFPVDKDYQFPLSDEAKSYYKSGAPFWQRYLPFWLANLVERFILLVIPAIALLIPLLRTIPQFYNWRIKSRIYHRYGELKFLETQMKPSASREKCIEYLDTLDHIEERVNHMKVPLDYSEHIYGLRGHIDFVRARIRRAIEDRKSSSS